MQTPSGISLLSKGTGNLPSNLQRIERGLLLWPSGIGMDKLGFATDPFWTLDNGGAY